MWKKFYVLLIIIHQLFSFEKFDQSNYRFEYCMCVPFWQCKEDHSGLNEDGIDIVDIRFLNNSTYSSGIPISESCTGDFDVCCKVQCGKRGFELNMNSLKRRILDGSNAADFAEFPWMLGLLHGNTYRCGASLIHPQVALTAAHCVQNYGIYQVRAGEWNWENIKEPLPHQNRLVKKIIIHPNYHSQSLRNDIALLILEQSFKLMENVGIICLPSSTRNSLIEHQNCVATGWGKNSYRTNTYQSILKKVDLPIIPRNKCVKSLQNARLGPMFVLHRSFICAGGQKNKDTCKGDGGSPLICPIEEEFNRYEQVGIVSWGLTCGIQDTPGVYVNVALFVEWIDFQMMKHNFDINVYKF